MSPGGAAIIGALIAAVATVTVALINKDVLTRPNPTSVKCDPIPAIADAPTPRSGYEWIPADFKLSSEGELEIVSGHWERKKVGGIGKYVSGHWDTSAGRCVWVLGKFIKN